ncbi:MAG: DNA gyrase subunit A [Oligoflexia bacterium]|nr:DNA gyrase subunit A [Oligoflexia bacterium]
MDDKTPVRTNVVPINIETEMRSAYLQYSMSVIVGRALPDVRDGLKPVHRRVLFGMWEHGNLHNKPFKKSARIVGEVMGKYHPHGDSAIYDTIVRMAQDFSMRYPLVDGQGNFGSIDGDSAAAMRYTEIRMTKFAEEILSDIDKETVDFGPNYDDTLEVPFVLPAKVPTLLVNGSSGIAVGMATNIPPHNLTEVIDGCLALIEEPNLPIENLLKIIPGPDFPTSGYITGKKGIRQAYTTGKGIISMRAAAEIEERKGDREQIIVTELPYMVNKAKLIEDIANQVRDKKIEGISDIRDESSREGMRMVIEIKKGDAANVVLNRLFKHTQLQTTFGIIMLALDNGQPKIFDLKGMLKAFVAHRREVVVRRSIFELKKAQERAHILEGLKLALESIDEVIAAIKKSKNAEEARIALKAGFKFSEVQANAILEMRLQRLTGLERDKIIAEYKEVLEFIKKIKEILGDEKLIFGIVRDELVDIKNRFGDKRRTKIIAEAEELEDEDLIEDQEMVVTITHTGYIKRNPIDLYRSQKRGGKGTKGMETREEDFVTSLFVTSTHSLLLCFTDKGKVYSVKVHALPLASRAAKGKAIANVLNLGNNEKIKAILPIRNLAEGGNVVMVTKKGIIKKTELEQFANIRNNGIIAVTTDLDDELIDAKLSDGKSDIFLSTSEGMSIRFDETEVRAMGRAARGVKGINVGKDDSVVGMEIFNKDNKGTVLAVTSNGYGKRTTIDEYRTQSRGGVGIITQKTTDKVGVVIGTRMVKDEDDLMLITDGGQVIRMPCRNISVIGRNTQGVRLLKVDVSEKVVSLAPVIEDQEEEDETTAGHA